MAASTSISERPISEQRLPDPLEAPQSVRVSLEEYLRTTYRPDRDWLDGELKERNMGEQPHSAIQAYLIKAFGVNEKPWGVRVFPEQRVQTSARHYRIADLCVVLRSTGPEPIVRTPPLLCVEILSRDDRMTDMQERVEDYIGMGVKAVWVIDPRRRKAYQAFSDCVVAPAPKELIVPGTEVKAGVADIFAELDWMQNA
jgi:Uma2 family endonuclease